MGAGCPASHTPRLVTGGTQLGAFAYRQGYRLRQMNQTAVPHQTASQRIPVLMYHRIGEPSHDAERRYCTRPHDFIEHMRALAASGHRAVSMEALFAWL